MKTFFGTTYYILAGYNAQIKLLQAYHFALYELITAAKEIAVEDAFETPNVLFEGKV